MSKFKLSLLGVVSLAILMVIFEMFLRGFYSIFINYDLEMWRYARLLKRPVNDLRSHIHKPSQMAKLMGVQVKTNSLGMRDDEFDSKNSLATLLIGDSFTLGWGVPHEDTFAFRLKTKLPELCNDSTHSVLNAGIGNYNSVQQREAYIRQWAKLNPKNLLLFWFINDADPIQRSHESWFFKHSWLGAFLIQRANQISSFVRTDRRYDHKYRSHYFGPSGEEMRQALSDLAALAKSNQSRLTVIMIPELHKLDPYPFSDIHEHLTHFLRSQGVYVIDTTSALKSLRPRDLWVSDDDPHPNGLTHGLIAETIFEEIKKGAWNPCR
ncbi:MAG: SGNH/GDSL hydrolase family protein [Oligoflexia bacterium]|nr:SGNH/GDSL hydrolase family protein [Oligoflexia bacterium]